MTIPTTTEVFIVIKDGSHLYYLLKVVRRDFDVYCIPPHLGVHYSVHESGEAHFRFEGKAEDTGKEPPVVLQGGEAVTPIGNGITHTPLGDLGRASGICTALYPINSLSSDFQTFNRSPRECFVIEKDLMPKDTSWVEIGVRAVPDRNKVSFVFNNSNIPAELLYKVAQCEPQMELGIGPIFALSPQAKGRVERLWGTFQDRLVAELRLAGATTLEQANQVLWDFSFRLARR